MLHLRFNTEVLQSLMWQKSQTFAGTETADSTTLSDIEIIHFVLSGAVSVDYHSININQVNPSPFVSLVLLAQYVECTAAVHDAFKPNKGP